MRCHSCTSIGEALGQGIELEAAVEAPSEAGEIALGVLGADVMVDASSLLGALIVTTIGLAAFSRQEMDATARRSFYCYLDEFQNFTTLSIANMFSELRKYRVGMIVVHQYLYQLEGYAQVWCTTGSGGLVLGSLHGLAISEADALDELTQAF